MIVLNGDWMNFDELQAFTIMVPTPALLPVQMFPLCSAWGGSVARSPKFDPNLDQNTYPCAGGQLGDNPFRPGNARPVPGTMLHIFDKVYVKTRGWIVVLFTQIARDCATISGGCQGENMFEWQVEHVRQPSSFTSADFNYNIPNDAYMWKVGDLLFGGLNGVGSCAARCPSSGEYDNIKGTIQWKPKIAPTAGGQEYWLYTMFLVGESNACKHFNCDEAAFVAQRSRFSDVIPNPDGLHPLTFFEGTIMNAFVPYNPPLTIETGCIHATYTTEAKTSITFRLREALFGVQRVTDFDFCVGCVNSVCRYDVMPCRWRSTIDTKWSYYMYVFHPSVATPLILLFHIMDARVIAVQYTNTTDFEGSTFTMLEIPKIEYQTTASTFDRAASQFLDLGSRVFNIASNGGFTGVALLKFTGTPGENERIFDFGNGQDSDNILITRNGVTAALGFSIRNGNVDCIVWTLNSLAPQDTWLAIVVTYTSANKTLEIRIGDIVNTIVCPIARTDRVVTKTYVGRSNWASHAYLNASIAGLYAIDSLLSKSQIAEIHNTMYTNVLLDTHNNIDPVGYFVNAASRMTHVSTPTIIPTLADTLGNIFTTSNMQCVSVAKAANRRLLTPIQQFDEGAVQVPVKSSRRVQRIYPLAQHGRKRHGVHMHTLPIQQIMDTSRTTSASTSATVDSQGTTQLPHSGTRRMLVSTAASTSNDLESEIPTASPEKFAAIAREITTVNNNKQITDLLCGRIEHGNTCDMLSVKKEVSIAEFCLRESTFMQMAATGIRAQLLVAASSAVTEIVITSIARPGAYYKCKPTAIRRLLQTETILITYVTRAHSNYFVNLDILLDTGFSSLQRLTALDGTKLAICTSVSTAQHASVLVSVEKSDKDRICNLAIGVSDASSQLQAEITPSIHYDNSSLQFHVLNNQSLDMHGNKLRGLQSSASMPTYAIVLIVVGVLFACAIAFLCAGRHNYSRLAETETEHAYSCMFIHHHTPGFEPHSSQYAHTVWS